MNYCTHFKGDDITANYEFHSISNSELPFIFHKDDVFDYTYSYSNWHKNIEILYAVSGSGEVLMNFSPYKLSEGEIAVINSDVIHSTRTDGRLTYYCLIIDDSFLKLFGLDSQSIDFKKIIKDSGLSELFLNIVNAFKNKEGYYEFSVKYSVTEFLYSLVMCYSKPALKSAENGNIEILKSTIRYIKKNMKNKISVQELADNVGYSRSYFLQEFKKITGSTVTEYINLQRCKLARELIAGGVPINSAALESGFKSASYFTRTYKKQFGFSPSEK